MRIPGRYDKYTVYSQCIICYIFKSMKPIFVFLLNFEYGCISSRELEICHGLSGFLLLAFKSGQGTEKASATWCGWVLLEICNVCIFECAGFFMCGWINPLRFKKSNQTWTEKLLQMTDGDDCLLWSKPCVGPLTEMPWCLHYTPSHKPALPLPLCFPSTIYTHVPPSRHIFLL